MARVIISSGHSSANPGSVSGGLREVDLARLIAKSTLKFLRSQGVISLSVPPEMELLQRIDWINGTGYTARTNDICIEIHINDGGKSGIEAWYEGDGGNPSQQLTEYILEGAVAESKLPSQGAKSEYKHEIGSISFIHETIPTASLIECGYIDNLSDAEFLRNPANIDLIGKGIAKGICKFLKVEFRELPAPSPTTIQSQAQSRAQTQGQFPVQPTQAAVPAQPVAQPINRQPIMSPQPSTTSFNNNSGFGQQPPVTPTGNGSAFTPLPSREERRKMIVTLYTKILGREPSQNDINYFLNIGIREDELLKKMMESQEHADLVKSKQEFSTIKQQFETQQSELAQLKTAVEDQTKVIEGLNYSISQKNAAIVSMQNTFSQIQANSPEKAFSSVSNGKGKASGYKGSFLDRLFKAFSDLFE